MVYCTRVNLSQEEDAFFLHDGFVMYNFECKDSDFSQKVHEVIEFSDYRDQNNKRWGSPSLNKIIRGAGIKGVSTRNYLQMNDLQTEFCASVLREKRRSNVCT